MNTATYLNNRIIKPFPIALLVLISTGYLLVYWLIGQNLSVLLLALTILIPIIFLIFLFPDFGFLLTFFYSGFFFFLGKHFISKITDIPQGVFIDVLLLLVLISYIINGRFKTVNISWKNPIVIILILYFCYLIALVGNPYGSISGWLMGFRILLRQFITILLSIFLFSKKENLSLFIRIWFILAISSMLYGIYQYFFGIPSFELKYALSHEKFYKLNFINGRWRLWSFLNNSTDFGLFMSASGVFFLIYSLYHKNKFKKMLFIFAGILMLVSSSFSGTRTAIAIAVLGIVFFVLFEIHSIKTISSIILGTGIFIFLVFGPINNPIINRVRSTFYPKNDASYQLREWKMKIARSYIYTHPIGGGLNSSENKPYPLSYIYSSPDSYYIGGFLQQGVIGMLFLFALFLATIIQGIKYLKIYSYSYLIVALLSAFFILSISGYAQENMDQFPYFFIFWGTIGFIITLDKKH